MQDSAADFNQCSSEQALTVGMYEGKFGRGEKIRTSGTCLPKTFAHF